MELKITMNLDNAAFEGRNGCVREVRRILQGWLDTNREMGRLNEQRLRDVNGNTVGAVELEGE